MLRLICGIVAVSLASGAVAAPASQPARPLLIHVPGIAGPRAIDDNLVNGLKDAGAAGDVVMFDWTDGGGGLAALRAYEKNRRQAKKLAADLLERLKADPQRPIYLTGHSGGAGIVVWALEELPPEVSVKAVLLLAPALSPGYDLSKALAHVAGNAHVFYSPNDGIVLGAGTRLFGTMDGVNTEAAGRIGFTTPKDADARAYTKLVPHPYDSAWAIKYGNSGDHIGVMSRRFARGLLSGVLTSAPGPTTRMAEAEKPPRRS